MNEKEKFMTLLNPIGFLTEAFCEHLVVVSHNSGEF